MKELKWVPCVVFGVVIGLLPYGLATWQFWALTVVLNAAVYISWIGIRAEESD